MRTKFPTEISRKIINLGEAECDFDVTFNTNRNWYFGNGPITLEQADFKLVAAKQLATAWNSCPT